MTRARRSGGVSAQAGCAALRRGDGGVDLGRRGERDLARDRAGGRVGDRLAAAARAGDAAAADEVADVGRAREVFVGAHGRLSWVGR